MGSHDGGIRCWARRFSCATDAIADLKILAKKWEYHSTKIMKSFKPNF